jgi:ubiquinone/menaquinone biosynthesis C-methylase UbiE
LTGIDIRLDYLRFSHSRGIGNDLAQADALHLPFARNEFSITCCHFFLLWVQNPAQALSEMKRVTAPGGYVVAIAEPDYGGRIDHPVGLVELGSWQAQSLQRQGADPFLGRKLKGYFHAAGLRNVQVGILGGQWSAPPAQSEWESEWDTLESDLADEISAVELAKLKQLDFAAWQTGERILFVPTFYASGQV